jgi:membrane fusion protein, multidrug efflux system
VVVQLTLSSAGTSSRPSLTTPVPSVLRLPLAAVMGDSTVYRLTPQGDGTALIEKVPVKIGRVNEEVVEILSGLQPGDLVVGAGVHVLSEGERVRLPADGTRPL